MPPAWVLEQDCVVSSMETSELNQYGVSCDDATFKTASTDESCSSYSSPGLDSASIHSLARSIDDRWPEREDTKVKFDLDHLTKVHSIPNRDELSPQEYKDVWLGPSDYNRITSWNRMTVKMVRQRGTLDDEPEHCSRGLEHRLKGQQRFRQSVKTNAIYGVLHEQARQRVSGSNVQRIADIYRGYVFGNDEEAKKRGIQDEIDAKKSCRHARTQSALGTTLVKAFDEDDLKDLRALMNGGEDEGDASEVLGPHPKPEDDDKSSTFEEKVKKRSKVKRISSFFKKKSSKPSNKSEQPSLSISPSPPPSTSTRRLRRSSM
jgi:hypothetical protein